MAKGAMDSPVRSSKYDTIESCITDQFHFVQLLCWWNGLLEPNSPLNLIMTFI